MAKKKKKTEEQQRLEKISQQKTTQQNINVASSLATAIGNVAKDIAPVKQTTQKSKKTTQKQTTAPIKTSGVTSIGNAATSLMPVRQQQEQKKITTVEAPTFYNPLQANQKSVAQQILTPQQIKSPENIKKTQEFIKNTREQEKAKGGNTSVEGTILNGLKLYGRGAMKAEEGLFIDAPVGIASTIVNAGKKVGYGLTKGLTAGASFITGIFDKDAGKKVKEIGNSYADSMLLAGDAVESKLNKFAAKDLTGNALDYYGWNNKLSNGKTVDEQLENDSAIKSNTIAGETVEGLGGMLPSILLGGIIGTSGMANATTVEQIKNVQRVQKLVSYSTIGARSYGNAYEEAINNGATTEQANSYGLGNAAVEIGTEWLTGGIPGVKGTAGGGLDGLFEKYVLKEGIDQTSKSMSKAIIKGFIRNSGEMLEEQLSEFLSPFVKQFTYQYDESKGFKGNFKEAANKISFEDIMRAGIVGLFDSILLGGINVSDLKAGYQNSQAINQVVNSEIANAEQQVGRELTLNEKEDIKTYVNEEFDKLREQSNQETQQEQEQQNQVENETNNEDIKKKQYEIIEKTNPKNEDLSDHTWIENQNDINTYQEALQKDGYNNNNIAPDFTSDMVNKALETNTMTVYSSHPIENGVFVTPSKMEAQNYAGNGQVYSKEVNLNDVAWIDSIEGQYANVNENKLSTQLENNLDKTIKNAVNDTQAIRKNIQDYVKENKLSNPTVEQMMESLDNYELMDTFEGDINAVNEIEKAYRSVAEEIYNENQIELQKQNTTQIDNSTLEYNGYQIKANNNATLENAKSYQIYDPVAEKTINNFTSSIDSAKMYIDDLTKTGMLEDRTSNIVEETQEKIAPLKEDLSNISKEMKNLSKELKTLQKETKNAVKETKKAVEETNKYRERAIAQRNANEYYENITNDENYMKSLEQENNLAPTQENKGYVETAKNNKNANQDYTAMTEKDAEIYQNALMQDEGYLKSLEAEANTNVNEKLAKELTDRFAYTLGVNKNQRAELQNLMNSFIENDMSVDEIADELYKRYVWQEERTPIDDIKNVKKAIRETRLKVDDTTKIDLGNYNDFRKDNFGKINISKDGIYVDEAYDELHEEYPNFFPSNIVNPTDQLMRIAEVANMSNELINRYQLMPEDFDNIADTIRNTILEDRYNTQVGGDEDLQKGIQFDFTEDVLPTAIRTQESIDDFIENRDIAPLSQEQINKERNKIQTREKLNQAKRIAMEAFENRNYVLDQVSKATGNSEITAKGDKLNNIQAQANFNIDHKQTDIYGNEVGEGLNEIFAPIEKEGLGNAFNDYLAQKSNIERHAVGKGSQVPLEVSKQLVAQYERENPQFKEYADKVYKFIDNYTKEQVNSGLISEKTYKDYRGEFGIYGSYVPFVTADLDAPRSNITYDNEGKVKAFSTFKKSTGGASDVSQLKAMKDAIANQVRASKNAIAFNELAKEIVQSYDKYNDAMDIDVRTSPTDMRDSLYVTPDGDKVLTAYIDGEKVSAVISDELFNELARTTETQLSNLEDNFSPILKPVQKASNIFRKVVTTWNPAFVVRNAVKDIHEAVFNSKHTTQMLKNYLPGIVELAQGKTVEAKQFMANYGTDALLGDYSNVNNNTTLNKVNPFNYFGKLNELIELAPRFAEYKASLQAGESIDQAMYNAREVTLNFGRGGYITKALSRNGFTFLNANVQGLSKIVRNVTGQNGAKGYVQLVTKGVMFGIAPALLNHLLFGGFSDDDEDEDYAALPDYIKDNYYLIKLENGKFMRIPKGRIVAVMGSLSRRTVDYAEGNKDAYKGWAKNAWSQVGVGDVGSYNMLAPLFQAHLFNDKSAGKTWYGGDIVPTRLQDTKAGEQTDSSIDAISNFIGKNTGLSPYKINYLLDQYTGFFGDVLLPTITPETTSGAESPLDYLTAPLKDTFIVNSTDDNKYAGDFYSKKDELEKQSNSINASDEDILKYKYMDSKSKELSKLYKEKREIQADETLSNSEKYAKVQAIQNEINSIAKEGLANYESADSSATYGKVGDIEYYKNNDGEWKKVDDNDMEFTAGLSKFEKTIYYQTKNDLSAIDSEYKEKTKSLGKNDTKLKNQYSIERKKNITKTLVNSYLNDYTKAMVYSKYYSTKENMTNAYNAGYKINDYITALYDIEQIREKYSQKKGYSTSYRKRKTLAYINSLNMNIPQKAMLVRSIYSSFRAYNKDIVNYVNNLDISYEDKKDILKQNGMTIKGNRVTWK